jgi:hypothetical protein
MPARDLFVGRAAYDIGSQSTLGAIFTSGDPRSPASSHLLGLDFAYRERLGNRNETLDVRGWWQDSRRTGVRGDSAAYGFSAAWPNDRLEATLALAQIGRNFSPALGFVNRTGIRQYDATLLARHRVEDREATYSSWQYGGGYQQIDALRGGLESRSITLTPVLLESAPGGSIGADWLRLTEVLAQPFTLPGGLQVAAGRYDFDRLRFTSKSAQFRQLALGLELESGDFYHGQRDDARVTINYRPNKRLLLTGVYGINRIELPTGRFKVRNYSLTANVAMNVRWAWLNVLQYDNVSRRLGLNSRLRWLSDGGHSAYLVVNYDWREDLLGNFRPFVAETTLKLNYTFRY